MAVDLCNNYSGFRSNHRPWNGGNHPELQSIESAIQAASFSNATLVVVRGIVTSSRHGIVIEDRTGAIEVKPVKAEEASHWETKLKLQGS